MSPLTRVLVCLLWPLIAAIAVEGGARPIDVTGVVDRQVLQRDERGLASLQLRGNVPRDWVGVVSARVVGADRSRSVGRTQKGHKFSDGAWECRVDEIPTGGPYRISIELQDAHGALFASAEVADLLVGDLWVLAGQSNMEGMGDLVDVESPSPLVRTFSMTDQWEVAAEPLHRRVEARDPVYHPGNPKFATPEERKGYIDRFNAARKNGAGLGLSFAKEVVAVTHVPVGLIPCAMSGTPISSWDSTRKAQGGASLYGAMLRRIEAAGGRVRGLLWYQGESDARVPEKAAQYESNLVRFIGDLRADLREPELPFYMVQIGRMLDWIYFGVNSATPPATMDRQFLDVREAQRQIATRTAHTGMVPSIDLELRDAIHLSTPSLKRAGRRLANLVLNREYGRRERPIGPNLRSVRHDAAAQTISVRYSDVTGGLAVSGRLAGFSLWRADGLEVKAIYHARVDPAARDTVVLSYHGALPADVRLAYGWGVNPFCNLTDEADMAAPSFGPLEISTQTGPSPSGASGGGNRGADGPPATTDKVAWQKLPPLPPAPGRRVQPGVAGPFVGVSANALLVAGGANFPDRPMVEGGKKTFAADVYVLEKQSDGALRWLADAAFRLPRPCGYGGSISIPEGVVCIGGSDATDCARNVLLLKWNPATRTIATEPWPDLPEPAVDFGAALAGQHIFVAGGKPALSGEANRSTRNFWTLDLSRRNQPNEFHWVRLPSWPGPARSKTILVAQTVGGKNQLFLFSGRTEEPGKPTAFLTDAYRYDPATGRWDHLQPVGRGVGTAVGGRCVMVGTGVALPTGEIAVFGGSDGVLFRISDDFNRRIAAAEASVADATDPVRRSDLARELASLRAARRKFLAEFPGFSRDVLLYHPADDRWTKAGEFPELPPVTTTAAGWDGGIVIPAGEIIPGIRTDKVWKAIFRP